MRAIIVGCGRTGSRLARQLAENGHDVTVIDEKMSAFARLGENFPGNMLIGTGIDEDLLRRAGVEHCDCFASLTNGDNRNIMAAQIAKEIFRVPRVITRIYDPIREQAYRELGMDTLCTTTIAADMVHEYFATGVNPAYAQAGPPSTASARATSDAATRAAQPPLTRPAPR